MPRYYTKACNFYFGKQSKVLVKKKQSIPLHQIKEISFDHVEIITRKKIRKISINKIRYLPKKPNDKNGQHRQQSLKPEKSEQKQAA